jgi:FAD/FMN-containing dehydrogenase
MKDEGLGRRRFLRAVAAAGLSTLSVPARPAESRRFVVNDVSRLNPVPVARPLRPSSTDEIRAALRAWGGPVSVGGGRFSMGGQIAAPDSMHLDMRGMNRVVSHDPKKRVVRVQAGITWRDIQDVIDPDDLSIAIMQSYANFSVGGSISVNCHGRYVNRGPLVNSVRALQMLTADGEVLELGPARDPDLFHAVIGGYGGLGVVTEAELSLDANDRIERIVGSVPLASYPAHFRDSVLTDKRMVMHNADLQPPLFDAPRTVSWIKTEKPVTQPLRLVPRGLNYDLEKNAIWAMTELPGRSLIRSSVEKKLYGGPAVVWRNHEASLDAASLEPRTRAISTYLLQEYFIPVPNFLPFARAMAGVLRAHRVEALNVSIRHSPPDRRTLMTWAPAEVFSFVLYYKQRNSAEASEAVGVWTRELIDAVLANGGRYYLPYRLDATPGQFRRAYPEAARFAAIKRRVDPTNRFRNLLWDKYL